MAKMRLKVSHIGSEKVIVLASVEMGWRGAESRVLFYPPPWKWS
jgi:hypothetical protein